MVGRAVTHSVQEDALTEMGLLVLAFFAAVVLLTAAAGFAFDRHRRHNRAPGLSSLLIADQRRAQATLNYYVHVHDSSD